ncbi:potassium transporter KefB [Chryseobacterium gossypii]|uniref:potassium transporter KefB n=1 Tax=Chryseobacterium gossypii TaxID=3231602 RepID=UPI0035239F06
MTQTVKTSSLIRKVLLGAITGLLIISFFIFTVEHPKPEWGKLWMIRPLVITPLAGAFGGLLIYSPALLNPDSRWKRITASILSFIAFIITLWLGIVLGLDGTLWN